MKPVRVKLSAKSPASNDHRAHHGWRDEAAGPGRVSEAARTS
jgi:hypothetical protein